MEDIVRLKALSEQMSYEKAEDHSLVGPPYLDRSEKCPDEVVVHPAVLPNGQRIKLLKTLLTSACEMDCYYCPFRAGRDYRRATFQPEEFARLFIMLFQKIKLLLEPLRKSKIPCIDAGYVLPFSAFDANIEGFR